MNTTRLVAASLALLMALGAAAEHFRVGFAQADITPTEPTPMWGYGARRDALSTGTRDLLYAKAIVIDTADGKAALVGLDIGRAPTEPMMDAIKAAILEEAGIEFVLIVGSHTHHGPVIELLDEEGKGQGKFDAAVRYAEALPGMLTDVILEAASNAQDARVGWGSKEVTLNRNRHSNIEPKPVDRELAVIRFDDLEGNIIALAVNFAAHPTMLPAALLEFSAEWPGVMMDTVQERLGAPTAFFQGACGDLSPNRSPDMEPGIEGYGKALAEEVIAIAEAIDTAVPDAPSVHGFYDAFVTPTRLDFGNPLLRVVFAQAFFPELANAFLTEVDNNEIKSHLTTVVINRELALVGVSGEVFAALSNHLKARSRAEKTLVFGFANDHKMYYPTIEGAAEGGYGGDPQVAWVELGTGERLMDRALKRIYAVLGAWDAGMVPQPAGIIGSQQSDTDRQ